VSGLVLIETLDRVLDEGILIDASVWGSAIDAKRIRVTVRPDDDDGDGGRKGPAQQMRLRRRSAAWRSHNLIDRSGLTGVQTFSSGPARRLEAPAWQGRMGRERVAGAGR